MASQLAWEDDAVRFGILPAETRFPEIAPGPTGALEFLRGIASFYVERPRIGTDVHEDFYALVVEETIELGERHPFVANRVDSRHRRVPHSGSNPRTCG